MFYTPVKNGCLPAENINETADLLCMLLKVVISANGFFTLLCNHFHGISTQHVTVYFDFQGL